MLEAQLVYLTLKNMLIGIPGKTCSYDPIEYDWEELTHGITQWRLSEMSSSLNFTGNAVVVLAFIADGGPLYSV